MTSNWLLQYRNLLTLIENKKMKHFNSIVEAYSFKVFQNHNVVLNLFDFHYVKPNLFHNNFCVNYNSNF